MPASLRFSSLARLRSRKLAVFVGCVIALLAGAPVHSLDPNTRITQYIHLAWRIQDGSAPDGMATIAQTSDGFLWFTSVSKKLYRFDGVKFVLWSLSVDGKTRDRFVTVFGGHGGGLWAVGADDEIVHFKDGRVISHFGLKDSPTMNAISEDSRDGLWVAQGGYEADAPLCHVTDTGATCFGKTAGVSLPTAESLLADGKGGFWMGGAESVEHWQPDGSRVFSIPALKHNPGVSVQAIARDANGAVWIGMLQQGPGLGLARMEQGSFKTYVRPGFDGGKLAVSSMISDRKGSIWVATTGQGLFRIRGDAVEHYGRAEGLSSDNVMSLLEDDEGTLWVTTPNGIDSFRDPAVTIFSASEGLTMDYVGGVMAGHDGTIYVANGDALDRIKPDGTISSIRWGKGLPGDQVFGMLEDHAGNIWMGSDHGLFLFKDGRFTRIPEPDHHPLGVVLEIVEDTDGNIWAECAGNPAKLIRVRDFQIKEEFPRPQMPMGRLAPAPQGGIWLATPQAELVLFRHGALQRTQVGVKGVPRYARAQADGSVLVAYEGGLVGLRNGKVQHLTTKNGLPCDSVFGFVQDKEKHWWINSECGIVELSDAELQRWWADPEAVLQTRLFSALDGARPRRATFDPAALSPDGRVWFAGGVVQMISPSVLAKKAPPAKTYVESLTVDRKQLAAADNLELPPHLHDLEIHYTSPTFLIPQRVQFRYRLEPHDREWHDAGTRRQAYYTDLPPGKYSFRVLASNSDGVWDNTPATLNFSVAPAYYQTSWFRALCALAFLALLWAVYAWRLRLLRHEFEVTLNARVSERTRIARELHDTLLQSFHGLLLRFQAALLLLPERPVEAKERLETAIEQAAGAITEGRDAVQGLRDSTVEHNDLALAIRTLGEELAAASAAQPPQFRVAVEGEPRDLHPILRDDIYRIAAEALRNAFLHAEAKQIEVELRYDDEQFRLRVRDDGKGIDPAIQSGQGREGHFGLSGMRERAALIGAKLTIWSKSNSGTEVELRLAAKIA